MQVRPVSRDVLTAELVAALADRAAGRRWLRVLVDGAAPTGPTDLAATLVDPLRALGHPVLQLAAGDFLRPASLRFEHGRTDPDGLRHDWLDAGALRREVLDPLEPGGTGRVLPSLWDAERDRATRADYTELAPGGVLLLAGSLLLGHDLPAEHTVHLWLSPAALARRTPAEDAWALPAYAAYENEVRPRDRADHVVLLDNPDRPALHTR
jgi:hypothetical protein